MSPSHAVAPLITPAMVSPQVNSMKELYLLLEEEELAPQQQADNKMCTGDAWTPNTVSRVPMKGLDHPR